MMTAQKYHRLDVRMNAGRVTVFVQNAFHFSTNFTVRAELFPLPPLQLNLDIQKQGQLLSMPTSTFLKCILAYLTPYDLIF